MEWLDTPILTGSIVRLEPLSLDHLAALQEAAGESDLSALWYTSAPSAAGLEGEILRRLELRNANEMHPYTLFSVDSGRPLGLSGYLHVAKLAHRLEIGGTWMRPSAQRTGANVEAKLLLLQHAFEAHAVTAVELRTHRFNHQSRTAIEALGAQLDGILRNHFDTIGMPRDTCVYSICDHEWPTVKRHLTWRLGRYAKALGEGTMAG